MDAALAVWRVLPRGCAADVVDAEERALAKVSGCSDAASALSGREGVAEAVDWALSKVSDVEGWLKTALASVKSAEEAEAKVPVLGAGPEGPLSEAVLTWERGEGLGRAGPLLSLLSFES